VPLSDEIENLSAPDLASGQVDRFELDLAIQTLPDILREPFVLVKMEGLKYREVAEILELPVGTVQGRVRVAAQKLRAGLGLPDGAGTARTDGAENGEENPDAL
jgi:RNA polymerase sigma-70 factor (ECF subfamily)